MKELPEALLGSSLFMLPRHCGGGEFHGRKRALGWCRVSVAGLCISSMSVSHHKEEAVLAGLEQLFGIFTNKVR